MALLQEIKVPLLAVNDTILTVVDVVFLNGQQVKKGDIILVFETSKTTFEVLAETNGFIQYVCEEGKDYEINEVVASIFSTEDEIKKEPVTKGESLKVHPPSNPVHVVPDKKWEGETLFSFEAIRLIELMGISRSAFEGKDFVGKHDVEELTGRNGTVNKKAAPLPGAPKESKPAIPVDRSKVIVEKLASSKKKEIEYLSSVQSTGLTSTINTFVEAEGIFIHLNQSLKYLKNALLPVILYETARLLKKFPVLNACFTEDGTAYYQDVHVGFAIDIDKGLKVLKIGRTAEKGMSEIEAEILDLSNRYLDDTLKIDDLTDITFTVTDLSAEGVAFFQPLVNMMNSAILGVSAIDEKQQRCVLSCTFDHRVTEGKTVARFLGELKSRLESYRAKHHQYPAKDIICYKCKKSLAEELGDVGFVKGISPDGKEGYICQSCLKGF